MGSRLYSTAQDRQAAGIRRRQQFGRHRGNSRGPQFCDQAAIHHGQRLAGLSPEQHDDRKVRLG